MKKNMILIAGMPGSGKSTLLNTLVKKIPDTFPISVDMIQETLYDTIGFSSPMQRRTLRHSAFALALKLAKTALSNNFIPVLEYPFGMLHKEQLTDLFQDETNFITVRLELPVSEAYKRFHTRELSTKRHPGHFCECYPLKETTIPDYQSYDSFKEAMSRLKISEFASDKTITVKAVDFPMNVEEIVYCVKSCLSEVSS